MDTDIKSYKTKKVLLLIPFRKINNTPLSKEEIKSLKINGFNKSIKSFIPLKNNFRIDGDK